MSSSDRTLSISMAPQSALAQLKGRVVPAPGAELKGIPLEPWMDITG